MTMGLDDYGKIISVGIGKGKNFGYSITRSGIRNI